MAKKAVHRQRLTKINSNRLNLVIVKESKNAKRLSRLVPLKKLSYYLAHDGRMIELTGKQGSLILAELHKDKHNSNALRALLMNLQRTHSISNMGEITSDNIRFEKVQTRHSGKRSVITFRYQILLQSGDDRDGQEKPEKPGNPGSLSTGPTCWGRSTERH